MNVSIIGSGYMASEHLKVFTSLNEVDQIFIYSRNTKTAQALVESSAKARFCASLDELYSSSKSDLVIVCVPELHTKDICEKIKGYPWKILVEKPLGYNLTQAREISDLCQDKASDIYVAFNRRYYSAILEAESSLSKLSSEQTRLIEIRDQEDQISALSAGQPELVVQNWMYANSIHLIDLFYVFGRGEIHSVVPVIEWNKEKPSFVCAKITFDSGDVGIYTANWNKPGPWRITISTDEKFYELKPIEKLQIQEKGSRQLIDVALSSADTLFKPGLLRQAEELVSVIKSGAGNTQLPTLRESLRSMELVGKIYQ